MWVLSSGCPCWASGSEWWVCGCSVCVRRGGCSVAVAHVGWVAPSGGCVYARWVCGAGGAQ